MAEVVLIPTGQLEHAALGPALLRLFPGNVFHTRPQYRSHDGFTSVDVSHLASGKASRAKIDQLARELVASVVPGQPYKPADFAYVIEDLELINDHQPDVVVQVFRDAVMRHIESNWPSLNTRQRVYAAVRDRCSFHLFRPMTEAYFFGESAALQRAGVAPPQAPQLVHSDWEQFLSSDTAYLGLPAGSDRVVDMPERQRHPKSYLHYLCDPTLADKKCRYKETKGGVAALRALDWPQVLTPAPHCPFLHALLDDLAEALGQRPAFVDHARADVRTRYPGPPNPLLRNV